jgi:hypothetical protein
MMLVFILVLLPSLAFAADLTITWTERTEADVAGYYIYVNQNKPIRVARSPYSMTVPDGTTYRITVTAIDTGGRESEKSSEVIVSLPVERPPTIAPPDWVSPTADQILHAGPFIIRWAPRVGAAYYELYVHQYGTPYDCAAYLFCGKVLGTQQVVAFDAGASYDFWIHAVDSTGTRGESRGTRVTVVEEPPSTLSSTHTALLAAVDACIKDKRRTILKCFKLLHSELSKVAP